MDLVIKLATAVVEALAFVERLRRMFFSAAEAAGLSQEEAEKALAQAQADHAGGLDKAEWDELSRGRDAP